MAASALENKEEGSEHGGGRHTDDRRVELGHGAGRNEKGRRDKRRPKVGNGAKATSACDIVRDAHLEHAPRVEQPEPADRVRASVRLPPKKSNEIAVRSTQARLASFGTRRTRSRACSRAFSRACSPAFSRAFSRALSRALPRAFRRRALSRALGRLGGRARAELDGERLGGAQRVPQLQQRRLERRLAVAARGAPDAKHI
eukprot:2766872-Pleurochrysis_carterae.AAC.2